MRVLLCSAAVAVALAVGGCGSDDSGSSSTGASGTTGSTTAQRQQEILHYITREARPRNPGPHPGARVDTLVVREVRVGQGPALRVGDSGIFEFISTDWVTGREIEESWHRRRPYETRIEADEVIGGWWQAIPGMRVGGRRQIVIPPSLGFTTNPDPDVQRATTYFDVVLVELRPQQPAGLSGATEDNQPRIER